MIPKTIHYCWFGKTKKDPLIERCIDSWKKHCPDYAIVEWNENNFDVYSHPFTDFAYSEKKWAFVSDYARFKILYEYGGIYLDTDMLLLKNLDILLKNKFFTAYEKGNFLSCGAIGAEKGHKLIQKCLNHYDTHQSTFIPVPKILTANYTLLDDHSKKEVTIYPTEYFYPFDQYHIKKFNGTNAPKESFGVHLWNYSWGNPLFRTFNKFKGYHYLKIILDKLRIKNFLKKILNMN